MSTVRKSPVCLLYITAIAAIAVAGKPSPRTDQPATYAIEIKDFAFSPRTLRIAAGARVRWTNKDEEPHKLVEVNSLFTSPPLDTDGRFTF